MKLIKKAAYTFLPAILLSVNSGLYAKTECLETLQEEIFHCLTPELQTPYNERVQAVNEVLANMFNMRYRILIQKTEDEINNFLQFVNEVAAQPENESLTKVTRRLKKLLTDLQALVDLLKQYIGKKGFVPATDLSLKLAQYEKIAPRFLQEMAKKNPLVVRKKVQDLLERQ